MWYSCVQDGALQESLSTHAKSRKQVGSAPPPVSGTGVDLLTDPAVAVIKSLNRCVLNESL